MTPAPTDPHPSAKHHLTPLAIGLGVVFAFVALFTSALHDPEPLDVKIAVVGSDAQVTQLQQVLDSEAPDGFDLVAHSREETAAKALADQDVQGVFIPSATAPRLLTASASGFAVTDLIVKVFTGVGGPAMAVHDVAPLPEHDSKGLSGYLAVAGTTVGSLIFSAALFLLTSRTSVRKRFAMICCFAPLAGLLAAIDTRFVAHGLDDFWAVAGVLTLVSLAVALPTAAVIRLTGAPGVGLCVVALAFTSLPASGGALGYQFLPAFYHSFAAGLPSTSGTSALRGAVYFSDAGTAGPILVLLCWSASGVVLYALASLVRRVHPHPPMLGVPQHQAQALIALDRATDRGVASRRDREDHVASC